MLVVGGILNASIDYVKSFLREHKNKLMDNELQERLANKTNRAKHQTSMLYNLLDGDFEKLLVLLEKLKNCFVDYCPASVEEIEKVLAMEDRATVLNLDEFRVNNVQKLTIKTALKMGEETDAFIEEQNLKLKSPTEGYVIPYSQLKRMLEKFASKKDHQLSLIRDQLLVVIMNNWGIIKGLDYDDLSKVDWDKIELYVGNTSCSVRTKGDMREGRTVIKSWDDIPLKK